MTGQHPSYEDLAAQRRGSEKYREGTPKPTAHS